MPTLTPTRTRKTLGQGQSWWRTALRAVLLPLLGQCLLTWTSQGKVSQAGLDTCPEVGGGGLCAGREAVLG